MLVSATYILAHQLIIFYNTVSEKNIKCCDKYTSKSFLSSSYRYINPYIDCKLVNPGTVPFPLMVILLEDISLKKEEDKHEDLFYIIFTI